MDKIIKDSKWGEIICNSENELEFYVAEATKLIENRQAALLETSIDKSLYMIKRKDPIIDEDGNETEVVLLYDQYDILFTSVEKAQNFMDSFMDIGMQNECEIIKLETYRDIIYRIPMSMLGDDLVINRIEFKEEDSEVWHCEDLIYDPISNK